jgi:galactitol-specific phosphotransferase system IIC component
MIIPENMAKKTHMQSAPKKKQKTTKDRGGKFFPYVLKEEFHQHKHLLGILKTLQIFDTLSDGKRH